MLTYSEYLKNVKTELKGLHKYANTPDNWRMLVGRHVPEAQDLDFESQLTEWINDNPYSAIQND